jgi:ACS family hexuronate transporter-like MFS transporter
VSAPTEAPPLSARRGWAIALVATLAMAVSYVDRQVLAVLAPVVTNELAISDTAYGWLAAAFSMAYLVGAPLAGQLIARVGVRSGLTGAVLVWSVVAALHALVPGYWVLFALRIALGLAEAPSFPGAATSVQRALPAAQRARGFGVLFTGSSVGAALAPLLATSLSERFGWRGAFFGTALIGLTWVPLWWLLTRGEATRRLLAPHAASPGRAPGLRAALRDPAIQRASVATVAAAPLIAFVLLWGSKFLVRDYGLTMKDIGPYMLVPPILFDLGAILFGDIASRRTRATGRAGVEPWLFALAATLMLALALTPLTHDARLGVLLVGIAMAGGGAVFALLTTEGLASVKPELTPVAPGVTAAFQSLAYVIANPLLGMGVDHFGSFTVDVIAVSLWVVPGALVWVFWRRRAPLSAGNLAQPAG